MIKMRGKSYQLYRRVPKRFKSIEPRTFVWLSLHTDTRAIAESKAIGAWAAMVESWEARLAGDTKDADRRLVAAQELAAVRGFRYLDVAKVADLPASDILDRVEDLPQAGSYRGCCRAWWCW